MRYCIIIDNKIKEEFSSQSEADVKLNKLIEKEKSKVDKFNIQIDTGNGKNNKVKIKKPRIPDIKLVKIPEITMGLKIYNQDNRFIGEIVGESEKLWFTKKSENQVILDPWMKENFEGKYILGLFKVVEED